MPLLGKKPFDLVPPPEDIKKNEEVFVVQCTNEVFKTYNEYVEKVLLYSSQVWSCQYTGKSSLNFEDAQESENKAIKLAKQFPKCYKELVLRNAHHWTSGLEALVDKCCKEIDSQFNEDDTVNVSVGDQIKSGKIEKVYYEIEDCPPSPSSDKENPDDCQTKSVPIAYDIRCDDGEMLSSVKPASISPSTKCPSRQLMALFIKVSMSHPLTKSGDSVYVVKKELLKKYQIKDKLKDFSFSKKNGSTEPLSTIQSENNSKPAKKTNPVKPEKTKKISPEKNHTDSKSKAKKIDPLQRSLDCFRIQQPNIKITKCDSASPMRVKSYITQSGEDNSDDKSKNISSKDSTPKPQKTMLKSVNKKDNSTKSSRKSRKSENPMGISTPNISKISNTSNTKEVVVELEKCPELSPVKVKHSGSKVMVEPLRSNSDSYELQQKTMITDSDKSNDTKPKEKVNAFALLKSSSNSPKLNSSKSAKSASDKKSKTERKGKVGKEESCEKKRGQATATESCNSTDVRIIEKSPKKSKKKGEESAKNNDENKNKEQKEKKNKMDKMKKTAEKKQDKEVPELEDAHNASAIVVEDSQDNMEIDKAAPLSPVKSDKAVQSQSTGKNDKKKTKQKTLSEIFNIALQREKPKALTFAIKKAIEQNVSPLSLDINTPAKEMIKEKYEKVKWRLMSAEEKQKIRDENKRKREQVKMEHQKLVQEKINEQRTQRAKWRRKVEDTDLELKPLPEGKTVVLPDDLNIENFSDVLMVVEFIYNYKELFAPAEKLNITTESLMKALTSQEEGFTVLSRVLLILVNVFQQTLSKKKFQDWTYFEKRYSNLILTENSVSELARLFLDLVMTYNRSPFIAENDIEEIMEILKEMETKDYYSLKPTQKLKILVALCNALLSSYAIDDFIASKHTAVLQMKRQKFKEEQEQREKKREEQMKLKQLKQEAEEKEKNSSQENTQTDESTGKTTKSLEEASSKAEDKTTEEQNKNTAEESTAEPKEETIDTTSEEPSNIVKALKNRRLQLELNKIEMEKKEKEEKERQQRELEEQMRQEREDIVSKFKSSLRMLPLGYDRYHRRYWLFNGINGLFVEDGWMSNISWQPEPPTPENDDSDDNDNSSNSDEGESTTQEAASAGNQTTTQDAATKQDQITTQETSSVENQTTTQDSATKQDQITTQEAVNTENQATTLDATNKEDQSTPQETTSIENAGKPEEGSNNGDQGTKIETVDTDQQNDSNDQQDNDVEKAEKEQKGFRENKSFRDVPYTWRYYDSMEDIKILLSSLTTRGIRESVLHGVLNGKKANIEKNFNRKRIENSDKTTLLSNLRQSLVDISGSVTRGMLGEIDNMDEYISELETSEHLAPLVIKLFKSIYPRFLNSSFTKHGTRWLQEVEKAKTASQLYLLLEVLDNGVMWDMSAEGARCKVCRKNKTDEVLLLCDDCNLGFHLFCLRPPLNEIPKGEWKCVICQRLAISRSRKEGKFVTYVTDEGSVSDEEEGEQENEDYCYQCQEGGDLLICCDTCPLVFHKECHEPALKYPPRGEWSCMECKRPEKRKTRQQPNKVDKSKSSKRSGRRNSDESTSTNSSKSRKNTKKRQLEDDSDSETETRKKRKISRRRKIAEDEYESEPETRNTRKSSRKRKVEDDDSDSEAETRNTRKSSRKRKIEEDEEEDSESDRETRSRRRSLRKRKIEESEDESEEEEDEGSDEEEEGDSEEDSGEEEEEGESGASDDEEDGDEDSGVEEEQPARRTRNSRNTRSTKASNQQDKKKAPAKSKPTKPSTSVVNPAPSKKRRTNPELEICETILIEMLRSQDSWPFLEPVNLKEVTDYLELVSEPMDFKTIKERLEFLQYGDAEPFVRDMRLVFENCDTYNHISTEEGQAGEQLSKEFEKLVKEHLPRFAKNEKRSSSRRR